MTVNPITPHKPRCMQSRRRARSRHATMLWRLLLLLAPVCAYFQAGAVGRYPGNVVTVPALPTGLRAHLRTQWDTNLIDGIGRTLHFGDTAYDATFAFGDASGDDTLRRTMATCAMMCYAYARYNADTLAGSRPTPTHYAVEMTGHAAWTRATHTAPAPVNPVVNAHLCSCTTSDASDPAFVPPSGPLALAFTPAAYGVGFDADDVAHVGVASLRTAAFDGAFGGDDDGYANADRDDTYNWARAGQTDCATPGTAMTAPAYAAVYHGHLGLHFSVSNQPEYAFATTLPAMYWHYFAQTPGQSIDVLLDANNASLRYPSVMYDTQSAQAVIVPGECQCWDGFAGRTCAVDMRTCDWLDARFDGGTGTNAYELGWLYRRLYSLRFAVYSHVGGVPYFSVFNYEYDDGSGGAFANAVYAVNYHDLDPTTDVAGFVCSACSGDTWGTQCEHAACDTSPDPDAKCNGHGYCIGLEGCRCDPGYGGRDCNTLDTNAAIGGVANSVEAAGCFDTGDFFAYSALNDTYTPAVVAGLALDPALLCSGRGTCAIDGDAAACQCDAGYTGPFCGTDTAACAEGASRACRQVDNPLSGLSSGFACAPVVVALPLPGSDSAAAVCRAVGHVLADAPAAATLSGHYGEGHYVDLDLPSNYDVPAAAAALYCATPSCLMASSTAFTDALRALPVTAAMLFRPLIVDATYAATNDMRSRGVNLWLSENFAAKGGDDVASCGVPGWTTADPSGTLPFPSGDVGFYEAAGRVAAFDAALRGVDPAEGRVDPSGATSTGPSGGSSSDTAYRDRVFSAESDNLLTIEGITVSEFYLPAVRNSYLNGGRVTATKPTAYDDIRSYSVGSNAYAGVLPNNWWVACVAQNDTMTLGDLIDMQSDTLRVAPLAYTA